MENQLIKELSGLRTSFLQLAVALRGTNPEKSMKNYGNAQTCEQAVNELARLEPKEMELEGGGRSWYYVCPECHGIVETTDRFCRHCGQAVTDKEVRE